jgi:hypothetical protein
MPPYKQLWVFRYPVYGFFEPLNMADGVETKNSTLSYHFTKMNIPENDYQETKRKWI